MANIINEALKKTEREPLKNREEVHTLMQNIEKELLTPLATSSSDEALDELYRLRDQVLLHRTDKTPKTILFASPSEGEGTSTVATLFALSLASSLEKVIVIDTNLANPHLHEIFSLSTSPGFSDFLLGDVPIQAVIQPTKYRNLSIVVSGVPFSDPFHLIDQDVVHACILKLKHEADWIIFDCPAVIGSEASIVLSRSVDGVILVIEADATTRQQALRAKNRFLSQRANLIGAVLNRRKTHIPEWLSRLI